MMEFDIVVAGAGPAGLCLTRELADSGLSVLLVDKKDSADDVQYNTSGSFIDPGRWNLPADVVHPIYKTHVSSKNRLAVKEGLGYVINRRKLLKFLEGESLKNDKLTIMYETSVTEVSVGKKGIEGIRISRKNVHYDVSARVYADCSGLGCVFADKVGLAPENPDIAVGAEYVVPLKDEHHTADLFIGSHLRGGYGWVFPFEEGKAIVGYGSLVRECFPNVNESLDRMWDIERVSRRCVFEPLEKHVGLFRTGRPLESFNTKNVFMVGDCALQGNPLVGEGIRNVMESAGMAAKYVLKAFEKDDIGVLDGYTRQWRRRYGRNYEIAYRLQRKMRDASYDDGRVDFVVDQMSKMTDLEFGQGLSGDFTASYLAKMGLKVMPARLLRKLRDKFSIK